MKTDLQTPTQQKPAAITSFGVLLARLTWTAFGPLALGATLWGVATARQWLTSFDVVVACIVGLMILGRWIEQRSGTATTMTGETATVGHCKRYTASLLIVAVAAWIAAKLLGTYLLR